jgi:hypothetical protein
MDAVDYRTLLDQLIRIEGVTLAPYRDAAGNLIVAPDDYVERMGVTATRMAVLEVDLRAVARELEELWPTVGKLDAVRKRVLIHMAFNMGVRGVGCKNLIMPPRCTRESHLRDGRDGEHEPRQSPTRPMNVVARVARATVLDGAGVRCNGSRTP